MTSSTKCLLFLAILCVAGFAREVQSGDPNLETAAGKAIGRPKGAMNEDDAELEAAESLRVKLVNVSIHHLLNS